MKTKLIEALENFSLGAEIKTFGSKKSAIEHDKVWKKLKRVWNNGQGLISFAEMDNGTLLINKLFCAPREVKDINQNLQVDFEFVELGYPDYYSKGLKQMRKEVNA